MNTRNAAFWVALSMTFAQPGWAQTANENLKFEVASIKPRVDVGTQRAGIEETPNLVRIENLPLDAIIRVAYGVANLQLVAPDWTTRVRFDIEARPPAGYTAAQREGFGRSRGRRSSGEKSDRELTPGRRFQSARIGVETRMSLWQKALAAGACVALLGCGSEPDSPLILGRDSKDVARGMRTLTSEQGRALQNAVMSAQEPCAAVERAYLRTVDAGRSESWDVLCRTGVYSVQVFADGTAADVRRCFEWSPEGCADPYSRRRFRQYPDQRAPAGQLNPDLGKLLEKMDSKDKKAD